MIGLNMDCDISEHLTALRDFVKLINAQDIVELGVRDGNSTQALIMGAMETGGKVTGIDISKHDWKWDAEPRYFEFIHGDDRQVEWNDGIDLLFIDTSHERLHTEHELEKWGRKVREGGIILLHDTGAREGVLEPAMDWARRNEKTFLNDSRQNGLGIILI